MNNQHRNGAPSRSRLPGFLPPLFSLVLPGSGQFLLRERGRGIALLIAILVLAALILWQGATVLVAPWLPSGFGACGMPIACGRGTGPAWVRLCSSLR